MQEIAVETVSLCVPAKAIYARAVRMFARNLAGLQGMTVEEIEDVRMAAEEAFIMSCASGISEVNIAVELCEKSLSMRFSLGSEDIAHKLGESYSYAELILQAVCAEFVVSKNEIFLLMQSEVAHEIY